MSPHVTVVIITLNEEFYLPHLLEDLQNQTEKNFEVIIVDAHSQDKTKEKALAFKDTLNLRFIESPKGQVSFQRNLGASEAKSQYVFFLDADARVGKTCIERVAFHIANDKRQLFLPIITPGMDTWPNRMIFGFCLQLVKFLQEIGRPMSLGPFIIMDTALFKKLHGFDEKVTIAEDHNIIIRAYRAGVKAKFLSDVPVVYSMRRFETKGTWNVMREYAYYSVITFFKSGIYTDKEEYVMGGQEYKKLSE